MPDKFGAKYQKYVTFDPDIIEYLISIGVSGGLKDRTWLEAVKMSVDRPKIHKWLIETGTKYIDVADEDKNTALQWALEKS